MKVRKSKRKRKSSLQKKREDVNSRYWKLKADKLWKELVHKKHGGCCAVCGSTKWVQAHHLIPRELMSHRHIIQNGMLLCAAHHRFSFILSAHKSPIAFSKWVITYHQNTWNWLLRQEPTRHSNISFKDSVQRLEQEYAMERQEQN